VSWEVRFPLPSDFSGWPSASQGDFCYVGAQSFYHTFKEFGTQLAYFVAKDGLFTLCYARDGQLSNEGCKQFL
jgi:hypothetical protein